MTILSSEMQALISFTVKPVRTLSTEDLAQTRSLLVLAGIRFSVEMAAILSKQLMAEMLFGSVTAKMVPRSAIKRCQSMEQVIIPRTSQL